MRVSAIVLVCVASAVSAQSPDSSLSFEVASVKAAAPQGNGRMMMGGRGGPGTNDPGRYTTTNMPLKLLLAQAYNVKDHQITGPSWLDSERYDIVAKVPPGATKEQFRVMLQNLLIERFKITLHRETKELPIYTLSVGKNGPKLKETTLEASAFNPPAPGAQPAAPPPPPPPSGEFPKMPPGRPGMMMMMSQGHFRLSAAGQSIENLMNMLSMQLGRPIIDKTGLTGKYDFQLDFMPEMGSGPMRALGPPPPGAGGPGGDGGGSLTPASDPGAPNLLTAIQELGLKLEAGKGPVDLVVVDKAERVPIEN